MGKCQVCEHYRYHAGVAISLQKIVGRNMPSSPTCYCDFANVSWPRHSGEVKKPRGISCNFKLKNMTCTDCGKVLESASAAWMVINREQYICKKCGTKPHEVITERQVK